MTEQSKHYQVIARRFRPKRFEDVIYQTHVSTALENSIKNGRISHAYLFTGARGVGKTTTARILAMALNCVNGPTAEPCGVCEQCREIKDGSSFDVIEIDAASNRGIDNIRDLREKVNFAPVKSRYKVYIIDEVHMLTNESFNALLKTLEEPPPHVVFILATTEIQKLPDTILSRCQKYFFKNIPADVIAAHLKTIVAKENCTADDAALYIIARVADGSMRDAQSLLEQVIAFSDKSITKETAAASLGVAPVSSFAAMLSHIASLSARAAVEELDRVLGLGIDVPRYAAGLADMLRAVRLHKHGVPVKNFLAYSDEEAAEVASVADTFFDEELSRMFSIVLNMQSALRYCTNERIGLEMAVLDMCAVKSAPSVAELIMKLESLPQQTSGAAESEAPAGKQPAARATVVAPKEPTEPAKKKIAEPDEQELAPLPEAEPSRQPELSDYSIEHPVVEQIKDMFHGHVVEKGEE